MICMKAVVIVYFKLIQVNSKSNKSEQLQYITQFLGDILLKLSIDSSRKGKKITYKFTERCSIAGTIKNLGLVRPYVYI